jgi:hypothetical protein
MKGFPVYRLNHDIQNIIEIMVFYYRMKNTNNEYRRVFYFFDTIYDGSCPNPHGRCVTKYRNAQIHWLNGKFHRDPKEGPAVEWANGSKEWYVKGQRHRLDGPAIEFASGNKYWYYEGKLHRLDGPAVEWTNGTKQWYFNDQRHRKDGHAIEWANGDKEWYFHNQRHRLEGPAIEYANGRPNEYWEFGNRIK